MDAQSDVKALYARVDELERQNQWMKRIGIGALVLVAAVAVMGQAHTSKVIEANGFRLKDATGKTRAELLTNEYGQTLLSLNDSNDKVLASLGTGKQGATLVLSNLEIGEVARISSSGTLNNMEVDGASGSFKMDVSGDGPKIEIEDKEGYSSVLGRSNLVTTATGKKEQTPAASLVLFNKDKKVLWSAP
jgi:hypothetical protein